MTRATTIEVDERSYARIVRARRAVIVVGGYQGQRNFGDVLLAHAACSLAR